IGRRLSELIRDKVLFSEENKGRHAMRLVKKMKPGDVLLLENLRFDEGEEKNSLKFARSLALLGDVYINEAFSVCHREHASVVALPGIMKHFAGPELSREFGFLSRVLDNPPRPLAVLIGGAKVATKIKVLKRFLKTADYLLLAGDVANTVLAVKGLWMGKPVPDEEEITLIKEINLTDPKIYLPVDVLASVDSQGEHPVRAAGPGAVRQDEDVFDIGPETISLYRDIIKEAKSVFWSGPLGCFEKEIFSNGTREIAQAIADSSADLRLAGGGDTVAALRYFNLTDRFSFVSTGGGAMLNFLAGERMPGLDALGFVYERD
ncbi:MAG: phosphoglycerate kinase, partial [Candidatus Pacebacteria bacterium]|nr:phosphoglycerate kinase [Candidatus Paceibacterota bacterium]